MSYIDKTLPIKLRLHDVIYGNICAAVYCFNCENGQEISIKKINESEGLKKWTKNCTKKVMEEYA